MKTRTFISVLILFMAVLIIVGSCATDKMAYISKDYEIYGTWANPEYNGVTHDPKMVINPNGIIDFYNPITATKPSPFQGEFYITNKWTDTKGTIWYTYILYHYSQKRYALVKISNSGKTLEMAYYSDYPKEIDPKTSSNYMLYYRQ